MDYRLNFLNPYKEELQRNRQEINKAFNRRNISLATELMDDNYLLMLNTQISNKNIISKLESKSKDYKNSSKVYIEFKELIDSINRLYEERFSVLMDIWNFQIKYGLTNLAGNN